MCICAWARVYVCGCCSKSVNWHIFAFIPVLSKWFVLYHLFSFVSACPPSLLCHVSWMCFSKFSMTPAVAWSTGFYFIYQLCPLDLWQGFCRSTVISFFILFFLNSICILLPSVSSLVLAPNSYPYIHFYCELTAIGKIVSLFHTLNLFFGIEVKTAWMLSMLMWQCIFTPFAFFIFLFCCVPCHLTRLSSFGIVCVAYQYFLIII